MLQYSEKEFKFMMHELDRLMQIQMCGDEVLRGQIQAGLNRPFILLQEYIPGYTLHALSPMKAMICFDMALPDTPDRLISLGKILAADIFMNNNDRLPMMYPEGDHQGNPNNLIFPVVIDDKCSNEAQYHDTEYGDMNMEGSCVAIDNKCFPIA